MTPEDVQHLAFSGVRMEKGFILDCVTEMASRGAFLSQAHSELQLS